MVVRVNEQMAIYNEAIADSIITDEEKARLAEAGITEAIQNELSNKTQDEIFEILDRNFREHYENSTTELSFGKKVWNVSNKIIGGILGGILGCAVGSRKGAPLKNTKIGGLVGIVAGALLSSLTDFKAQKPEIQPETETVETTPLASQDEFMDILPACTHIVGENDNLSKICNQYNVRKNLVLEANPEITDPNRINLGQEINIPERRILKSGTITNIDHVSVASQISKSYIDDIIFGVEGRHKNPDLTPYYDNVPDSEHPKGHLTIGFGHTGSVHGVKMTESNMNSIRITADEAHEILAQDLLNAKNAAIDYIGQENFDKAPASIQNALIDIAFNKGIELGYQGIERNSDGEITRTFDTPTKRLKDDLERGDYVSAAQHVIYETANEGLQKRNIFRIILATKDLSETDRNQVLDATESYYTDVKRFFERKYPADAQIMERAWLNARNGICEGFFD